MNLTIGSLFSGVGLLDLGLLRAGLGPVVWQVERDAFCRSVLTRHYPDAQRFDDVCAVGAAQLATVDVICGGFPCQPVSVAGDRKAQDDERWLWPQFRRIAKELRPRFVVIENVLGLLSAGLRGVLADLADLGFDAEWSSLSAFDLGAPHLRRRLFVVATDASRIELRQQPGWLRRAFESARAPVDRCAVEALAAADPDGVRRLESARLFAEQRGWSRHCGWTLGEAPRVDDGNARRLVGAKRKAAGNGVAVPCAEVVGHVIRELAGLGELP